MTTHIDSDPPKAAGPWLGGFSASTLQSGCLLAVIGVSREASENRPSQFIVSRMISIRKALKLNSKWEQVIEQSCVYLT